MDKLSKIEKQWILYDVGNSAYVMLCTTIIPLYFKNLASAAGVSDANSTAYLSYALSISTIVVAVLGPILGTMADTRGYKKPLFTLAFGVGVLGCLGIIFPDQWLAFLIVFVIGRVGYQLSLIFYDSMLIDITSNERMDEVSSHGYAWGYIGSCIPFIASLVLILFAEPLGLTTGLATGIAFAINAVWWLLTTLPLLKNYRQIHYVEKVEHPVAESLGRIVSVLKKVGKNSHIFYFLIAFFFYIDGVYTIIDLATSYGKDVGCIHHYRSGHLLRQGRGHQRHKPAAGAAYDTGCGVSVLHFVCEDLQKISDHKADPDRHSGISVYFTVCPAAGSGLGILVPGCLCGCVPGIHSGVVTVLLRQDHTKGELQRVFRVL